MTKSVLFAGLLGGLLGGVGGFALLRSFPTSAKPVAVAEVPRSETRDRADDLIKKLRADSKDDFFTTLRSAFVEQLNDEQFGKFREGILELRKGFERDYGAPGEFEFSHETVLSPSVVRVVYVEKYARGCVACFVLFYNTADGWRIMTFAYKPMETAFNTLR